ncbi:hypothetical protein AArc1_0086 [Natrarchaeobaculum sulfurireducens]|uniref:Uncharacterized protein n=1 Tax=Natrarchaeobaculum sulfurireducens TaxID=2044521 RepID=A0A346PA95_9EURY|nr:hypothetical protein AArc1_0086 [Natrarchaeobaculum sulfurireducens]
MNVAINLDDDYVLVVRPPRIALTIRTFGIDERYLAARARGSDQRTSGAADVATRHSANCPTGRSSESGPQLYSSTTADGRRGSPT